MEPILSHCPGTARIGRKRRHVKGLPRGPAGPRWERGGENGHRLRYACAADLHHEPRTRCGPRRREHGGAMPR